MEKKSTWSILSKIDCKQHIETKNGLSYLSWAWAWGIVKENFPSASYELIFFEGKPYFFDENLGYMVMTKVTIDNETLPMHLPVLDSANKACKHINYTYKVKEYKNGKATGQYLDKHVTSATMFDINTSIMRCLTKNLALFGLGHYIYAGEDLPVEIVNVKKEDENRIKNELILTQIKEDLSKYKNIEDLKIAYLSLSKEIQITLKDYVNNLKLNFNNEQN